MRRAIEFLFAKLVIGSLRVLPLPLAWPVARLYGRVLDKAVPRLRRIGIKNLAFALPGMDHKRVIDGVFDSVGGILLSLARFPLINKHNVSTWIRYEGFEHYEEAKRRGRGVLFATAHLGNWELSAYAHALLAEPMNIVVRPLDNPRIDAMVEERRALSGNNVIQKKDAARGILRALRRNEAVGILIDQNSSLEEGVFVDFFGVQACAGRAFARLAHHSGAAVIPGFALWHHEEKRYILRFFPAVTVTGDEAGDTQRIHEILERVIRQHPDQWLWIHRRWKTRPPGQPSLY